MTKWHFEQVEDQSINDMISNCIFMRFNFIIPLLLGSSTLECLTRLEY